MQMNEYQIGTPTLTLIKGEPGTGKTIAACSYPKPLYILSLDRKVGSIANFYENLDGIEYDFYSDFWKIVEALAEIYNEGCSYKTIVLDPLTKLSNFILDYSLKYRPAERSGDKKFGRKRGELLLAEIEDYGVLSAGMRKVIELMKVINVTHQIHMIMTAHVITVDRLEGQRAAPARALMTGGKRVSAEIPGDYDEIYHTAIDKPMVVGQGENKYVAHTRHTGDDFARTALPIPNEIDFTNKSFYDELLLSLPKQEVIK